jgi:hypothetical protein
MTAFHDNVARSGRRQIIIAGEFFDVQRRRKFENPLIIMNSLHTSGAK